MAVPRPIFKSSLGKYVLLPPPPARSTGDQHGVQSVEMSKKKTYVAQHLDKLHRSQAVVPARDAALGERDGRAESPGSALPRGRH